jgi:hypothetical protein
MRYQKAAVLAGILLVLAVTAGCLSNSDTQPSINATTKEETGSPVPTTAPTPTPTETPFPTATTEECTRSYKTYHTLEEPWKNVSSENVSSYEELSDEHKEAFDVMYPDETYVTGKGIDRQFPAHFPKYVRYNGTTYRHDWVHSDHFC